MSDKRVSEMSDTEIRQMAGATEPIPVTDEMVERACAALWWNPDLAGTPPYGVRARDYLLEYDQYTDEEKEPGGRRFQDLARFHADEAQAARLNREAMRKALEAALNGEGKLRNV